MTRQVPAPSTRRDGVPPVSSLTRARSALALLTTAFLTASLLVGTATGAAADDLGPWSVHAKATTNLSEARPLNKPIRGTWGTSGWFQHSSPTLADIDGNARTLEVVIGSLDGQVYVYRADGSVLWKRYLDAATPAQAVGGSPAVGDIDNDGRPEIVVGSDNGYVFAFDRTGQIKPGWPKFTGWNADYYAGKCGTDACTGVVASPTLADLDGNGTLEVIVGSYSHLMYVWDYKGTALPGWPRDVWDGIASGAAVGDINADGRPEIVVGSDVTTDCADCPPYTNLKKGGLLHAFTIAGKEVNGWPVATDAFMHSTPALVDLTGDGVQEVVAGAGLFYQELDRRGKTVVAIRGNGTRLWAFTARSQVIGAPAVGDLTGDGKPEVVVGDYAGWTYVLDRNGVKQWETNGVTAAAPNGAGAHFAGPVLADVSGDGKPDIVTTDSNWRVKAWSYPGRSLVADVSTLFPVWGSAAVGDVDGDGSNEVVAGSAAFNGPKASDPTAPLPDRAGSGQLWIWDTPGVRGLLYPQYQSRVWPIDRSLAPSNPAPGSTTAKVYRFWSPKFSNAHFFTTSGTEAVRIIDTDVNWLYEGAAFRALTWNGSRCADGRQVYRFYSAVFQSHFYTQNATEKEYVRLNDPNWSYEGVAYCAYTLSTHPAGSMPLYRFWSPVFGKHFYTASRSERDQLDYNDPNWDYEGIAYYVLS